MSEQQPPEMFSLALSNNNKVTIGFRLVPITQDDLNRIYQFLGLLAESIIGEPQPQLQDTAPEIPTGTAAKVLRGHFPTEVDLATAAERVAAREHIWSTAQAMDQARQQSHHVRKVSGSSSSESDEDSQT